MGKPVIEGESPVHETDCNSVGSGVLRDTRNPVGSRGDHPPKARYYLVTDRV